MGLKSGSRDAGLEETEESRDPIEDESSENEIMDAEVEGQETHSTPPESTPTDNSTTSPEAKETGNRPAMSSIPYKQRREKVNEGREQVPYFLREEIIDAEEELHDTLEEILDEDVYKSDYREAAMVVAQRNPELIAEVLREWGYDLETA